MPPTKERPPPWEHPDFPASLREDVARLAQVAPSQAEDFALAVLDRLSRTASPDTQPPIRRVA